MNNEIKILCVDDEESVLNSIKRLFTFCDYTVLLALSGEEGLKILERETVHIIISDYRMPVMNGAEFLKEVRKRWPNTVRIVLSGYADTASILSLINEGHIYKFIPKPWNDEELKVAITNSIERYFLIQKNDKLTVEVENKNDELAECNMKLKELLKDKSNKLEFTDNVLTLYQNFFYSLPIGVCGIDFNKEVILHNSKWTEIMGREWYASGDNINKVLSEDMKRFIEKVKISHTVVKQFELNKIPGRLIGGQLKTKDSQSGIVLMFIPDNGMPQD